MIRSMTGFGQGSAEREGIRVSVEVRSTNHRYVDLRLRLPACLQPREREIRKSVLSGIRRGRVEMGITVERDAGQGAGVSVNRDAVESMLSAAVEVRREFGVQGSLDLRSVLVAPGVLQEAQSPVEFTEEDFELAREAVRRSMDVFDADRVREGIALRDDLLGHLELMKQMTGRIRERSSVVPEQARRKLEARLEKLAAGIDLDPARLAQEAAILADRCDITEELVRLESHLQQLEQILNETGDDPVGKRMDFLLQEINRETNTINSKSGDLEISREALGMKNEAEKVREQAQNLE